MSKLQIVRRCYSCGKILQSEDPTKEGYINPRFNDASLETILFCDACYNEEKFNQAPQEISASEDFLTMLEDASASDALIVYVVDLFSFECCFIQSVNEVIRGSNILVIANKRDLLPSEVKDEAVREYVAHRFRVARLNVSASDVILASANMSDSEAIIKTINDRRMGHDIYCIGAEKAGKTYFLSSFLRHYKNTSGRNIVTKKYSGTGLHILEIPLDKSTSIYDTPGTSVQNTVPSKVESELVRLIVPTVEVTPRKEALQPGDSVFLGGLARIELVSSKKEGKQEFTFYASDSVKIRKVSLKEPGKEFFAAIERKALSPVSKLLNDEKAFDVYEVKVDEEGSRDIGIAGLGWFNFIGANQTIRVYVPHGVSVYGSRAKI